MAWETVIGLEVHAQLKTQSKLFSGANTAFGAAPNTQVSYVDAGLPGTLPVLNQAAVHMAIQFGLAIEADISPSSYFERKNYFYPDLPKGYQISQFLCPIVGEGHLNIQLASGKCKKITIQRAHLEEDAGKSVHEIGPLAEYTGIDLNRAGVPLLEIVTAPCLSSAEEVLLYLKKLHQLLRFLDICDGNMQEGSFRCDVNLSLRPQGSDSLGVRTEIKNLNSFRFIEKAIVYEQRRHQDLLENGLLPQLETRLFCPVKAKTESLRSKEQEADYRYFPDPDLQPIVIDAVMIAQAKNSMPKLPEAIEAELKATTALSEEDIYFLLTSPSHWAFYSAVQRQTKASAKTICNWLKGPYTQLLKERQESFTAAPVAASQLADLLSRIEDKFLTNSQAKQVFAVLALEKGQDIDTILHNTGQVKQHNGPMLLAIIEDIIQQFPQQAEEYRQGRDKLLAFFVGQTMKQAKGQASPEEISQLLQQQLLGRSPV